MDETEILIKARIREVTSAMMVSTGNRQFDTGYNLCAKSELSFLNYLLKQINCNHNADNSE